MWQDKLKEIIYILENSNVNEIEVNFWGRKYRVSKQANVVVQDGSIPIEGDLLDIFEEYELDLSSTQLSGMHSLVPFTTSFQLGDVNMDASINVVDVVSLVGVIFGNGNDATYADLNSDNIVNIFDVILLIDIIFNI